MKAYLAAAGVALLAIMYALINKEKALRYKDQAKGLVQREKVFRAAAEADRTALKEGKERKKDALNSFDDDDFSGFN